MSMCKPLMVVSGDIVRELECIVCMEQVRLQLLPCGHRCCPECIDGIKDEGGEMLCPFCRREIVVPAEGFPICRLSDFLRDQVNIAQNNAQSTKRDGYTVCSSCDRPVEARCYHCMIFLCYRCTVRTERDSPKSDGKHLPDDLEDIIPLAYTQLENWRAKTKHEIKQLEETMKQTQRELDDKVSVLKASEMISTETDKTQLITLIEQTCDVKAVKFHLGELPASIAGIKLMACFDTDAQCTTVNHLGKDKLAVGCSKGLKLFHKTTGQLQMVSKASKTRTAVHNEDIYITYKERDKLRVKQYSNSGIRELFSFPCLVNTTYGITANQSHVYVLDKGQGEIVQYDLFEGGSARRYCVPNVRKITNIELCPDGSLLVVASGKKLLKMRAGKIYLTESWRHTFEESVCGIAVTSNGGIFVAGLKSRKLFFLNENGDIEKEFFVDQFPNTFEDMRISGTELIVAGWNNRTLLFFQLH